MLASVVGSVAVLETKVVIVPIVASSPSSRTCAIRFRLKCATIIFAAYSGSFSIFKSFHYHEIVVETKTNDVRWRLLVTNHARNR